MVEIKPVFGENVLSERLNAIGSYILVTMEEPWELLESKLDNPPKEIIFNRDMDIENLKTIEKRLKFKVNHVVGFGGGTSCDTAKYLSWKWKLPLIVSPSIISVDAWLCRSIAVREDHKVKYIGDVKQQELIVDYSLIKQAPKYLNWAGIADVISITTALGDWLIARDKFGDKFNQDVFDEAKKIAEALIKEASNIKAVNDKGIRALVKGQVDEVVLCEAWGNARPEEGSEHFLGYCLEDITHAHYIHGNLIALNILVVLKLQRDHAVFNHSKMKEFFDEIGIEYSPIKQKIKRDDYKQALETIHKYMKKEKFFNGLWTLENVFDQEGDYSVDGILDWIYSF
ncbi:MAG: iron-containing alcohol dehydrogenase [Candidatus Hodarchaeota archaeon]